jgi:hypothetical protein
VPEEAQRGEQNAIGAATGPLVATTKTASSIDCFVSIGTSLGSSVGAV